MSQIVLTSDTLASPATAGAIEYTSPVIYATPVGTQRGVMPNAQFYRLDANYVGLNATGAQGVFGVGTGGTGIGVTLSASTVYAFEAVCMFAKSAGTTSHNFSFQFGGTTTLTNINYMLQGGNSSSIPLVIGGSLVAFAGYVTSTSAAQVASGLASATVYITALLKGTVSVNAGGTFVPQYTLSAAPGGAYSTVAGSYFSIYPIGSAGVINVGTWS